ncbi:permease [Lewinellaceae bacterium SD302]|nr:permease [Lewinellaceae bacterium SD302]
MKQLDKLMARSFIGPFIVTFAIAMFVLLMQILWVYLDDIAGKGLSFFQVVELIGYKCVGLIPLALPLSLLISSVMVLGSLAEHYELSSFKSAGVSLFRIMGVMILFGIVGSGISYACSDYVIPAANIQFGARMYDIQQKKPTLSLEAGSFNEDFSEFVIRIGSKGDDGEQINDVHIYDHSKTNIGQMSQIVAETGRMYTEGGSDLFVMHLENGHQYAETSPRGGKKNTRQMTYVRTAFEEWTKIFDLSQFNLQRTSRNLFNQNRAMLATWQLQNAVDSIDLDIMERKQILSNYLINYLPRLTRDTIKYRTATSKLDEQPGTTRIDAGKPVTEEKGEEKKRVSKKRPKRQEPKLGKTARRNAYKHSLITGFKDDKGVEALFSTLPKNERTRVLNRARTAVRAILSQAESSNRILPSIAETRVKHVYDLHMKYSMALVCIIFIFIGAPMGAIVRKGGFGYPILVSIIFFVIFIILTIFCRKLAESFVLTGELAGWMPCLVLFPVGMFLTFMAMNDRKLGSFEFFGKIRDGLVNLLTKKRTDAQAPLDEVS